MEESKTKKEESKTKKNEKGKGRGFLIGLWVVSVISLFLSCAIGWQAFLIALGVFIILTPIAIVLWAFVEEGYCVVVTKFGAFKKVLMVWDKHTIDTGTWEISDTTQSKKRFLGGLFLGGFWPVHKIYRYHQRWANLLDSGEIKSYDEELDKIRLKLDMYVVDFPIGEKGGAAEDINGVPLAVKLVLPIKITNPYRAFFIAGKWLAMIIGAVKPVVRSFIGRCRYKEDLLDMRAGKGIEGIQIESGITIPGSGSDPDTDKSEFKHGDDLREKLWKEITTVFGKPVDSASIEIYGVSIQKEGMSLIDVDPDPKYRELTTKKYQAEQQAKVIEITADAKAKAEEKRGEGIAKGVKKRITDAPLEALAETYGKTKEEMARELPTPTGERLAEELKELRKEARAREGMDQGAYGELNVPGGAEALFALFGNLASKFIKPTGSPTGATPSTYEESSAPRSSGSGGGSSHSSGGGTRKEESESSSGLTREQEESVGKFLDWAEKEKKKKEK